MSGRQKTEDDVQPDEARVDSRATGGDPDRRHTEGGTTGTSRAEEFVGRVAGDEDFSGETGAERRAAAD
ncbi:hypothetical protein GCM10009547_25470 [Sporichthya brevicatena]|uniref:Uncharacterized protein n=1 Tax=Sporichthya brevicatena TaxID=171442 RepID=A0ABN1GW90_9ACTN